MRHNLSNLAYMQSTAMKFLFEEQFAHTDVLAILDAEFMPQGFFPQRADLRGDDSSSETFMHTKMTV